MGTKKMNKNSKAYKIGYTIGRQFAAAVLAAALVFIPYIIYINYSN